MGLYSRITLKGTIGSYSRIPFKGTIGVRGFPLGVLEGSISIIGFPVRV